MAAVATSLSVSFDRSGNPTGIVLVDNLTATGAVQPQQTAYVLTATDITNINSVITAARAAAGYS
jgi:hypothetical protein